MSAHDDILHDIAHRPWPLPDVPWVMFQSWQHQLFAHWRVEPAMLRPNVPAELELDLFDGQAWLGITPFLITGLHFRALPPLPVASEFPELNLRTYVVVDEKPGVYFFSLDAGSLLAVQGGRAGYGLPYFHADMSLKRDGGRVTFESRRRDGEAELRARYAPAGNAAPHAAPGTLEHFLVERYALYVVRGGKVMRGDIHHAPWSLHAAQAQLEFNTVATAAGLNLPAHEPLLHFSTRQDALIWPLVDARR